MAKYYRQHGETRKRKFLRLLRPVALVAFVGSLILVGFLAFDILFQKNASETSSKLSTPVSSSIIANTEIHTTPYFQFQTPNKWRAVANETRDSHYVYRQYNGQLVEQELIIDVNNQLPEVLALTHINRVLPLTVTGTGFTDVNMTELAHCKKAAKPGMEKQQQILTMDKVTFPCNPDFTGYEVVLGLVNGTNVMSLPRPSGESAFYKVLYRNVTATPSPRDLFGIIRTFETR